MGDTPASWNGTLILYSHGYGPLTAQNAPDAATKQALLDEGYALVGSSYSGPSMWATASAVDDQFGALQAMERSIGPARRAIAWGTSMGGLVSALEAQSPRHAIAGALTTCGLVAGGLNLAAYQLNGEYALAHLLAPGQEIKLVRYQNQAEAAEAAGALSGVVAQAQSTPQGRARIALGAVLESEPGWYDSATAPAGHDYAAQEVQQERELTAFTLLFTMTGRQQIELAAGGNPSGTAGVDYGAVLASSAHADEVRRLYQDAGLDLGADLRRLTEDADLHADPQAAGVLARTSTATGRLGVPELDIHTIADQLVPVEQENWYGRQVARQGDSALLRQAYVNATGHCAFHPAEAIAALHALEHRIDTGHWDTAAQPEALNTAARALQLSDGATPRYVQFSAPQLAGAIDQPHHGHPLGT